jgi:hypothetical protein
MGGEKDEDRAPCIGVLSGGVSRDELTSAGAAEVYPGPGDLLAALADSLLGAGGRRRDDRSR